MRVARTFSTAAIAGGLISSFFGLQSTSHAAESLWSFDWGASIRANIRNSEDFSSSVLFPPGAALQTVDPGTAAEISLININGTAHYGDFVTFHGSVDLVDLYDRNPTSGDNKIDIDSAWAQLGHRASRGFLPEEPGHYFRIGKFEKFERQQDRHSVSYGLVSTMFNRFEDAGFEMGADFGKNFYAILSQTAGNPLYFRDPNALAGDNGDFSGSKNSGFPMFYDAEIDEYDFGDIETGLGLGFRTGNPENTRVLDVLVFSYQRDLKNTSKLTGTVYGGDLDLLTAPSLTGEQTLWGVDGNKKEELGVSAWVYFDDWTLFGTVLKSEAAGLDRDGVEIEASYHFQWNSFIELFGKPMFRHITPVVRYSEIDPSYSGPDTFPAPSVWWDWEKLDVGATIELVPSVNLVIENAFNDFTVGGGKQSADELLVSVTYTYR
jgi:hypothetical protein